MNDVAANRVLTDEQKSLLLQFRDSGLCGRFYLSGGTALSAFYLSHRVSEDLDFFAGEAVEVESILALLRSLPAVEPIDYQHKFDRRI